MISSTANIMTELFNSAKENLTVEQLDWLGNASSIAEVESLNVSAMLNALAATYDSTDKLHHPSDDQVQAMLWTLSEKVGVIGALTYIGAESEYLAAKRKEAESAS